MAIIENISHFTFTGRPRKKNNKKKVDESVKLSQIVRIRMPESICRYKVIFLKLYNYIMVLVFEKKTVLPLEKQGWKMAG